MQKQVLGHAVYFTAGALIGGTTAYFITKKVLEKKYLDLAEEEIASVKETYDLIRGNHRTDEEERQRTRDYLAVLDKQGYAANSDAEYYAAQASKLEENDTEEQREEEDVPFDGPHNASEDVTSWPRSKDEPYVISTEEYMLDAEEYDKFVLTYFEADNTLAAEDDSIISDVDSVIGVANLLNFGAGTLDENTLYIRNDKQETDYEIVRNQMSYSKVVLGIEEWDAKDVTQPKKIRKMRDGS
jgi:hypothetical protein